MSEKIPSNDLIDFISRHLKNVGQLEILSLLVENPSQQWSVNQLVRAVHTTEKSVADSLDCFAGQGLLAVDGQRRFQFRPKTPELSRTAENLVKLYRERPVTVIEAIYGSRP